MRAASATHQCNFDKSNGMELRQARFMALVVLAVMAVQLLAPCIGRHTVRVTLKLMLLMPLHYICHDFTAGGLYFRHHRRRLFTRLLCP
jgi:hypothetical protein